MGIAIKVENLSKAYQLGEIGTGTISRDLERWVAKLRGKEDPFLKIGETNEQSTKSSSGIVWSLKDINFEIEQGDAVGIIGRNGAGKSTLLKILSRVTSPTSGKISGKGRIASLLEVGTGFHPELTGRENIYLNGAILGMRKKEITRKFDEIVEFAGVERYVDTPVKRYSSGMYVRLAFAVAAHLESEILIVDEVLAVGDVQFQKKCLGKMQDVSKNDGRTILFVSHNMTAIKNLCRSAILLKSGQVKAIGETEKIIENYLKIDNSEENSSHWINENLAETDIKYFKVYNEKKSDFFDIDKELLYETEIFNNAGIDHLALEIFLYNNEDCLLFNCLTPIVLSGSHFKVTNRIPASLLIPGTYKIIFGISRAFSTWIKKYEDEICFEIFEMNKREINFLGKWEGIIKPDIKTEIIPID